MGMDHLLDNVVWNALNSSQKHFNAGTDTVKFFPADISPFIGMERWDDENVGLLIETIPADRSFSVIKNGEVVLPSGLKTVFTTPLYQMFCPALNPCLIEGQQIKELTTEDVPQMLDLTGRMKPGPFNRRTIEFGNYIGLFDREKLIAMAGERLKRLSRCCPAACGIEA